LSPNYIQQVDRFGGGNVMMWAAISYTGRINMVQVQDILTAQRYCDEQYQYFSYIVAVYTFFSEVLSPEMYHV
jgi:hypothetical protein